MRNQSLSIRLSNTGKKTKTVHLFAPAYNPFTSRDIKSNYKDVSYAFIQKWLLKNTFAAGLTRIAADHKTAAAKHLSHLVLTLRHKTPMGTGRQEPVIIKQYIDDDQFIKTVADVTHPFTLDESTELIVPVPAGCTFVFTFMQDPLAALRKIRHSFATIVIAMINEVNAARDIMADGTIAMKAKIDALVEAITEHDETASLYRMDEIYKLCLEYLGRGDIDYAGL